MRDPHKLVQRTRLPAPHSRPLCAAAAADSQVRRVGRGLVNRSGTAACRPSKCPASTAQHAATQALPSGFLTPCLRLRQPQAGAAAEAEEGEEAAAGAAGAAGEARDPETFDDSEFYQTLLKEFLEGAGAGTGPGGNWLSVRTAPPLPCCRLEPPLWTACACLPALALASFIPHLAGLFCWALSAGHFLLGAASKF